MIPSEYRNQCIVTRETPYQVADELAKGPRPSKGNLDIGRVVWTRGPLTETSPPDGVDVFIDGVGPVRLDPHCLGHA